MTSHSSATAMTQFERRDIDCPKHGKGQEFRILRRWMGCPKCNEEKVALADKAREEQLTNERRKRLIDAANLPADFKEAGFKTWQPEGAAQQLVFNGCREYLMRLRMDLRGAGNLTIIGRTGTGKTHLVCAILRTMAHSLYRVRYVTSSEMVDEIASAWGKKELSQRDIITKYAEYDLLVIDDVGHNDSSYKSSQDVRSDVYIERDRRGLPTITTANKTEDELKALLGDRAYDRICKNGDFFYAQWDSYRQRSCRRNKAA